MAKLRNVVDHIAVIINSSMKLDKFSAICRVDPVTFDFARIDFITGIAPAFMSLYLLCG